LKYTNIIIIIVFVIALSITVSSQISIDNKDISIEQKCYTEYYKEQVPIYINKEYCSEYTIPINCKDKDAILNKTNCYKIVNECSYDEVITGYKTIVNTIIICKDAIIYKDDSLDYEKENLGCTITKDYIICDDDSTGDGNGDGICQTGETCHTYIYTTDKIKLESIYNGLVKIK